MTARVLPAEPRIPLASIAVIILGSAVLLLRLRVLAVPENERIVILAVIYLALAASTLLVPDAPGERARTAHCVLVVAIGLIGIAAARLAGGPPVPVAFGPWALPLGIGAAIAEEGYFRRMCYAVLERRGGPVPAIALTAALFAAIHVPAYGVAAFPLDLGAGVFLGWQRWETGTWTVPAATHVAANLMAVIAR